MIPMKGDLNSLHDNTVVKVYNPLEKKLIAVFPSIAKAANRLGITSSKVQQRCSTKTQIFSPNLQMKVALRLAARKAADEILLVKTAKFQPL